MKLILKKGEYKWSSDGVHVCDERGFAVVCEEDCEVEIPHPENFERASKVVAEDRKIRGVVPSFSIPAAAEPSSTESAPPAPEALPEQPAPEESAPAHVEPVPQEHGQESSASPETPVAAEESAQDQPTP